MTQSKLKLKHTGSWAGDIVDEGRRRVGLLGLFYALAFSLSYAVPRILGFYGGEEFDRTVPDWVAGSSIGTGVVLWFISRSNVSNSQVLNLALLFEVLGGLGISTTENYAFFADQSASGNASEMWGMSSVSLWILTFSATIPVSLRKMLIAGILTAATAPLTAVGAWLVFRDHLNVGIQSVLTPGIISGSVAVVVSVLTYRVVTGISRKVTEARRLGAYTLKEKLGEGGMGEVWLAEHRLLARPAAVKLIRTDQDGETVHRRFEREAQITATLQSRHTVALYDFGVSADGTFYYVMELLDGMDLDGLVLRHGPVDSARCIHFLRQASHSLAEAHARGLVHRDIKPANLFACRVGLEVDVLKVLDFGLARPAERQPQDVQLTGQHALPGTPAFLAPEVIDTGEQDRPADVYALGCVGYWLLTGRLLFEAETPARMVVAHLTEPVVPPSELTEMPVDPALETLLLECLAKNPSDRPTIDALITRLEALPTDRWSLPAQRRWWTTHAPANPVTRSADDTLRAV